ncbi:MAG: VOC family protein [Pseudomonadota bacterium]
MVESFGLTHISLAVSDPQRLLDFYGQVFGVHEYFRDANQILVQGPGPHDVLAFERQPDEAGACGGIQHFGFRLKRRARANSVPVLPYAYAADPDGYEVEIWYEP